jgi:pimeloyl-ACP methyl ester carboxylesterase
MRKRYILLALLVVFCFVLENCLALRTSDKKAVRLFQKKGISLIPHTLHIGSRDLHYVSVGPDTLRTIVFVHGSPGSWDAFERYLMDSTLRSRFRMISIDRPGFGYSNYGDALHLQQGCDMISSFLDSINNGKPLYLVGHSLGGSIVPILAADNPNKVTAIIILAGALDPALEPKEPWVQPFTMNPLRYLMPGAFRQANDEEWYFKTDVLKLKDKLSRIRCPVYIMAAANDMIVDPGNVAYMKRTFINAQVSDTTFPTGNHLILWNHSDYIIKVLRDL